MTTLTTRGSKGSELTHNELDANFDRDVQIKTTTYPCVVSDNRSVIECNHATTPFTVTLGDAATMAAADTGDYEITIANIGAAAVTVARAGSDTIDGAATSITLPQYSSVTLKVNAATDGYNSIARGLGGLTSTVAELNYSDGVTSNIQTQMDAKAPIADPTFTGEVGIGAVNVSETELGILEGATVTTAELNILDGVTSTASELNILDGVTSTTAELNELDASAAAVTGYSHGIRTYLYNDTTVTTGVDIDSVVTASTWESVGPTGSSADNIWTDMDAIPSGAAAVILGIYTTVNSDTSAGAHNANVYTRQTGSSAAAGINTYAVLASTYNTSAGSETTTFYNIVEVPLDSSNRFDIYWNDSGANTTTNVAAYVRGFIL